MDSVAFLAGTGVPDPPKGMDRCGWRIYVVAQQQEAINANPGARPSALSKPILAAARTKFLRAFPGKAAEADAIFDPGAAASASQGGDPARP